MLNCLLPTLALNTFRLQEEAAVIPVPFVLRRLTRDVSLLYVIVSTAMGTTYTPPSAPHRQKKSCKTKKSGLVASIRGIFFLALFVRASGRICFQPLHTISNDIKHHTMAKDESSSKTLLDESLLSSYFALCPFQHILAQPSHNDYLLRHSRCCQLLLPSGPQPPAEGRSSLRHLWVHRTAHSQAIPPLRWLRASFPPRSSHR